MKYLITGGAGFIESNLADKLLVDGHDIVALRFFTVYGPRQRPDLVIHKFTKKN